MSDMREPLGYICSCILQDAEEDILTCIKSSATCLFTIIIHTL